MGRAEPWSPTLDSVRTNQETTGECGAQGSAGRPGSRPLLGAELRILPGTWRLNLPRTIHTSYRVGTNGFAERGMQPPQGLLPPLNCHDYNQTMTFNVGSGPCTGRAETAEIASRRPAWVRKAQCRVLGRVLEQKNISGKRNKTPNESKLSEEHCRSDFLGFAKRTRVT